MNKPADTKSWSWKLFRWTVATPCLVLLVIGMGIGARYVTGKSRLDRLRADDALSGKDPKVSIQFQAVVPLWIRNLTGGSLCEPLDRMKVIRLTAVNDDDLLKRQGCCEADTVQIVSNKGLTDTGLSQLSHLATVRNLSIQGGSFSTQGLATLATFPRLAVVEFGNVELTPGWSDAIVRLRELDQLIVVARDDFTEQDIATLARHPNLRVVRLNPYYSVSLKRLDDDGKSKSWHIGTRQITRDMLSPLAGQPDIDTLVIECQTLESSALHHLARMPSLRVLQIAAKRITAKHLMELQQCARLESLTVEDHVFMVDHGLDQLAGLPSLTQLVLHYSEFNAQDVDAVAQLTRLKSLRIDVGQSDIGRLDRLSSLVNLEELNLQHRNSKSMTLSIGNRRLHLKDASDDPGG